MHRRNASNRAKQGIGKRDAIGHRHAESELIPQLKAEAERWRNAYERIARYALV